jgi:hypothetical protein
MGKEAKASEITDGEKGGFNRGGIGAGFKSRIVGTTRNVIESGNEFYRAVDKCIFEQGVGQVIVAAGFEIGGSDNKRSNRNKEFYGVGGAAKGYRNKGVGESGSRTGRGREFNHRVTRAIDDRGFPQKNMRIQLMQTTQRRLLFPAYSPSVHD